MEREQVIGWLWQDVFFKGLSIAGAFRVNESTVFSLYCVCFYFDDTRHDEDAEEQDYSEEVLEIERESDLCKIWLEWKNYLI